MESTSPLFPIRPWCPCGRSPSHPATAAVAVTTSDGFEYAVASCAAGVNAYADAIQAGLLRAGTRIEVTPL